MLYYISELLKEFDIPGLGLWNYLSFRAIVAYVLAMLISLIGGRKFIAIMTKKQIGETIRDLGLAGETAKKGTPTMGGLIIIFSLLLSVLLICDLGNRFVQLLILTTIWCGALGFTDDYIKVFKHNKNGLSERSKLIGQIGLGVIIAFACLSPQISDGSATTTIPFIKNHEFDYGSLMPWFKYGKWVIYAIMIIVVITACSNGANLTDGMDGLAAGTSTAIAIALAVLAYLGGNILNAGYLNIMYIPGSGEIAVFLAAFAGALIGFLWYNTFPAEVFMGDTGSLTIGGIIGVSAVLIRKELLLPILCGIFVVESASVLIQRFWFRHTKKKYGQGRRVFLMAPLHHHYQKKGIPEARIVTRFWLIGIMLGVATLAMLKIR